MWETLWAGVALGLAALIALAYFMFGLRGCEAYKYVNINLACSEGLISKVSYAEFQTNVKEYIDSAKAGTTVNEVAMYFRDLRGGPSWGIDSFNEFAPASLLKLPVVIAVLNIAEDDPDILTKKLVYSREALKEFDIPEQDVFNFAGLELKEGEYYTVEELMRATIVYSDNEAYYTLIKYINEEYPYGTERVFVTFQELGIKDPQSDADETVSVRAYAQLFRTLYNVSYLDPDASEKVLGWMAEATFDGGLMAGLPEGAVLADKFGERMYEGDIKQLHDCGIIYYPNNPYILCVMTKGREWNDLKKVIGDISAMVYKEVDSRAK